MPPNVMLYAESQMHTATKTVGPKHYTAHFIWLLVVLANSIQFDYNALKST